jgi:hypothetical protein
MLYYMYLPSVLTEAMAYYVCINELKTQCRL